MKASWIAVFTLAACLQAADPVSPRRRSHLAIGRDLYRENCAVCHDIEKDKTHSHKLGPSLNHLFKNETLPLGHVKPNRRYVEIRIKLGGTMMPAFGKRLTQDEIDTLIDYIDSK
jgi:mono/diheme cytochrome c family protein